MAKIVLYLNDREYSALQDIAKLMARDPQRQAYVILVNTLEQFRKEKEGQDEHIITTQPTSN